ncbi:MAG: hypothetical protein U1E05_07580 [Patescibacteria group bacterium]|nr:hypothetical protein [Patescibacteria group bacterium]
MIRDNEIVCAVVLLLAACAEGCQRPSWGEPPEGLTVATDSISTEESHPRPKSTNAATPCADHVPTSTAVVAPIFNHGAGEAESHGDYAFLSEEEALDVLTAELALHGIRLVSGRVLEGVDIAPRHLEQLIDDSAERPMGEPSLVKDDKLAEPLRATGMDDKTSIAVKFISQKDYERLGGYYDGQCRFRDRHGMYRGSGGPTYYPQDFRDAARYVAEEVRQNARCRWYVGVFYDPITCIETSAEPPELDQSPSPGWHEAYNRAAVVSKRLLRQQARDFVAWLRQQGVL